MQYFQGDVPVLKIEKEDVAVNYKPLEGKVVVAEGEVTGYKHVLEARPGSTVEIAQDERGYFLKVKSGEAVLTHEEHKQISFGVGLYFVGEQREYDEIEERKVLD